MTKFAYFNPQDGRVLQWIDTEAMSYHLPDASMLHACSDAEWALQHQGDMMVNIGVVVPYVATAPNHLQKIDAKWETIKAERDRRKAGGFKVGGLWFHSDADSRIQHLGLKDKARDLIGAGGDMTDNLAILGQPVRWKTLDGSFANVTAQLAFDIVTAGGNLDAQLFVAAETHKTAMEASQDPSAYDFSAGWPATYPG